MVAPNNALLYNAAIEGFTAGVIKDRWLTVQNTGTPPAIGTPDPSFALLAQQATLYAIECDSKVATDTAGSPQPAGSQGISVVTTGVAIAPTTNAIQFAQLLKVRLAAALSLGIVESRYYGQPALVGSSDLSAVVTPVYAAYLQIAAEIAAGITDTNNEIVFFGTLAGALGGMVSASPGAWKADEFSTIAAFADSLADVVDTAIPNDSTISAGNGQTLAANANSTLQLAEMAKLRLIYSISLAISQERNPLSNHNVIEANSEAAWAAEIGPAIVAAYNAISPGLLTTPLSSTPPLNPTLWNEAFCGFVAGKFAGRPITSASNTDANYVAIKLAAIQYANAIDAAVGASDVTGTPVPVGTQAITLAGEDITPIEPTTGPIQEGQQGKAGIMWAICRGTQHGRPLLNNALDTTESTYTATAKSVVALYLDLSLALLTP